MNGRYLRELSVEELTARLEAFTGRAGLRPAVEISREKMQTLAEFWPLAGFFFDGPVDDPAAREKWLDEDGLDALAAAREALAAADPFDVASIETGLARGGGRRATQSPATSTSRCGSRSPERQCLPGFSRPSRSSGKAESLRRLDATLQI